LRVAPDLQLVLGPLGTRVLELAGSSSDGTVTWLAGVDTVYSVTSSRACTTRPLAPGGR
jgi:hypothetical protein